MMSQIHQKNKSMIEMSMIIISDVNQNSHDNNSENDNDNEVTKPMTIKEES